MGYAKKFESGKVTLWGKISFHRFKETSERFLSTLIFVFLSYDALEIIMIS